MVDVSNYTCDTPVLIKIKNPTGTYVPELKTYIPLEAYTPISNVITILNRGIDIEFPKESSKHEISNIIEDMILNYRAHEHRNRLATGHVGTDVSVALDTIQYINDNHEIVINVELNEEDIHVFDYTDLAKRIAYNINLFIQTQDVFESEEYNRDKDLPKKMEQARKNKEILDEKKKQILKEHREDAMLLMKLSHDPNLDEIEKDQIGDLEFL